MYCSRCGTQNDDASKFCRSCGLDLSHTTPVAGVRDQQVDATELDLVREQLHDEYEILEELGRGGMAIVFKAREKQLERDVAIKVLPFSLAFDKEFVERFQREARTSAKLEHPSIIPIYRVGKSGRVIYFVMKFLRGKPLSSVLAARSTLPPAEIRQILVQVARALAYAHKSGIVHRDIKPDNIMFDEHGLAVVTDFGIAKAASGGKLTGTGMSIGTPHYMSPEQARAQPLDGRSDIYSLGVVAYQSLTGRVPFDGEDSFSIGYKHIMEEIPTPPLETYDQRTVFEITKKMMAKAPDERFQSADELVQVLEAGGGFAAAGPATAATKASPSLQGLPRGARVTLNGMPFRGSQGDVPPGTYRLAVRASGFEPYDRQVVITPGAPSTVRIELQPGSGEGGSNAGPCDQYGPAYNQDHLCFDTRPLPLSLTRIPVPADATIFPRQAILLIHVSKDGSTLEARVFGPSNLDTFNNEALDMAKTLRWNPAQRNGEPVDAWVQWIFQPLRQ